MKSKIIRRITSLLISAIVTLSFAAVPMLSASAFDNNVKSGTVAVVFFLKGAKLALYDGENLSLYSDLGDIEWSGGSGFFVGRPGDKAQYIVTNEHVVDDYITANEGEQYVLFTGQYTSDYSQALYLISDSCEMRIYYSQDDYDVAYVDCYGDMQKAAGIANRVFYANAAPMVIAYILCDVLLTIVMIAMVWKRIIPLKSTAARIVATLCNPMMLPGLIGNLLALLPWPLNQLDHGTESARG